MSVFTVKQLSYEQQYKFTAFKANDIEILKFINKGAFGDVFLGRRKEGDAYKHYAVKMISKTKILNKAGADIN